MVASDIPYLLLSDVAFLCNIRAARLREWVAREPWSVIGPLRAKKFTFSQMVEFMYVVKLRKEGVSLAHICEAHNLYRRRYATSTPFAKEGVLTHLQRILIDDHGLLFDGGTKQLVADYADELLKRITFNKDGNATQMTLFEAENNIIINPTILSGQPVIEGTRLETNVVVAQVVANDYNVELVASMYELTIQAVKDAIEFEIKHAV